MEQKLNGPVCLNHPDRLAVAHCCVCRRPVCKECLVEENGFKCCSRECLKMAKESTARTANVIERRDRSNSQGRLRQLIKIIVFLAVLCGIWFYRGNIRALYNKYFGKGQPTIKQRVNDYNRKNIEKDHIRRNRMMDEFEKQGL